MIADAGSFGNVIQGGSEHFATSKDNTQRWHRS
ncbi:hypothetical protein C8J35_11236 [Rhizobium sp. PP-F2F-G38]|nr:hypothetical protein C8J37_11079 [Rhizobium sp. PP-WC-1G-195]PYE93655.1 hypothetical protein C8J35_11236 [Rhizobium sp. PP-F2F-G38]TCP78008.1 hypothetical protein C8J31_12136 [Rhizobium sp. PP-CC-2G-626]TCQ04332.1 hypothetical protein C8J34_109130 [Rhizobium sp. PP-F2F-G36]TCQ25799.1 hypothetical protein C8J33_10271 [Rhizobium sp. PP-CC-3G-465]